MEKRMRSLPSVASPRLGKGSSNIWTIFTKYGDHTICKCNYCGKDYSCTTKNGTKSLWNHVNFQCTKYVCNGGGG
ncbi:hypothetical protein ACOSQ2_004426 [Xanthoceras sorbifolium]